MASFFWAQNVNAGCPFCGTSINERGFVDCIADVVLRNAEGEISGVADVTPCATCIEQAARLIGSATQQETFDMAQRTIELEEELEKTKDEVQAWSQRYQQLIDNLSTDISTYLKEKDANSNSIASKPKSSSKRSS